MYLNASSAKIALGPSKARADLVLLKVRFALVTPFEDPIILPDGRKLLTLKDAADYITKLPKKDAALTEWQTAIETLMLCSRGGGSMLARIGVMKALNRHVERVFNPDRKETHWGKRKLKRDQ